MPKLLVTVFIPFPLELLVEKPDEYGDDDNRQHQHHGIELRGTHRIGALVPKTPHQEIHQDR